MNMEGLNETIVRRVWILFWICQTTTAETRARNSATPAPKATTRATTKATSQFFQIIVAARIEVFTSKELTRKPTDPVGFRTLLKVKSWSHSRWILQSNRSVLLSTLHLRNSQTNLIKRLISTVQSSHWGRSLSSKTLSWRKRWQRIQRCKSGSISSRTRPRLFKKTPLIRCEEMKGSCRWSGSTMLLSSQLKNKSKRSVTCRPN